MKDKELKDKLEELFLDNMFDADNFRDCARKATDVILSPEVLKLLAVKVVEEGLVGIDEEETYEIVKDTGNNWEKMYHTTFPKWNKSRTIANALSNQPNILKIKEGE